MTIILDRPLEIVSPIQASSMVERAAVNRKVSGSSPEPEDLNLLTRSVRRDPDSHKPWRPGLR